MLRERLNTGTTGVVMMIGRGGWGRVAFLMMSAWGSVAVGQGAAGGNGAIEEKAESDRISVWYGDTQQFGHLGGHPQRWINVLGNVREADALESIQYSLNAESPRPLSCREDGKRIARDGDFNIEIDRRPLKSGKHSLVIEATFKDGSRAKKQVAILYKNDNKRWPLPYRVDWSKVDKISDAVQVVDGKWELTDEGIRTSVRYYDRVLAVGDGNWKDYEVTTTVKVHGLMGPGTAANKTGVTHAAIALRWPGHDADSKQPSVKWFPLGATAEFRLGADLKNCRWRIFDGQGNLYRESKRRRQLEFRRWYNMKHRVETLADGQSHYQVRLWPVGDSEPVDWDLQRLEPPSDIQSGSALLLAHFSDVTFGNITVVALP